MNLSASILAMLLSTDVWAVYGIGDHTESTCLVRNLRYFDKANHLRDYSKQDCVSQSNLSRASETETTPSFTSMSTQLATDFPTASTLEKVPPSTMSSLATTTASSPPAPAAKQTVDLDTGVKIGIAIAAGVLIIALLIVVFEACYLQRKRRARALQRALDEVERGTDKGSQERIVLESRVSIIFEDEDQEGEEEEIERGRNGMSLPRRE
jgi:hypothetical protein